MVLLLFAPSEFYLFRYSGELNDFVQKWKKAAKKTVESLAFKRMIQRLLTKELSYRRFCLIQEI